MDANSTGFMLQTMFYLINHNASTLMDTIYNERFEPAVGANDTRCYGVYGCFNTTGPWMINDRAQAQ